MTRRRKYLIVMILSSTCLLLIVGAFEIGARILGHRGMPPFTKGVPRIWHPQRGWRVRPNIQFAQLGTTGWVEGTTDADGFRPVVSCRDQAESPMVICLGDSTTFDSACRDEETWPEVASRTLAKSGIPCRMLNRAIRNYGTIQCLATLRETLQDPAIAARTKAVVYHFCANDTEDNVTPAYPRFDPAELAKENRDGPLPIIVDPAPPERERRLLSKALDYSALYSALRRIRLDTSPKAFGAGLRGTLELFDAIAVKFQTDLQRRSVMRAGLQEMARECRSRGILFFVSSFPFPPWQGDERSKRAALDLLGEAYAEKLRAQADTYRTLEDWLRKSTAEAGGVSIETSRCLDGVSYREYALSATDYHFSAAGELRVGETIAAQLRPHLGPRHP